VSWVSGDGGDIVPSLWVFDPCGVLLGDPPLSTNGNLQSSCLGISATYT